MKNIMQLNEYDDAIFYRAACACTDSQDDITLELEINKKMEFVILNFYYDMYYASYWQTDNWFMDKWYRIKGTLKLLFTGHIKVENSFMFGDEEQIDDFVKALQIGREKLHRRIEERKLENGSKKPIII